MAGNDPRKVDTGSLEMSAEGIKPRVAPSPVSGLNKTAEPSAGTDEETRQQLHRIEGKLDAILAHLKGNSR